MSIPDLHRYYLGLSEPREREVAAFVLHGTQWQYHSRGTGAECVRGLDNNWSTGAIGTWPDHEIRIVLDQSSWGGDRPDLCWSGPQLTVETFREWWSDHCDDTFPTGMERLALSHTPHNNPSTAG